MTRQFWRTRQSTTRELKNEIEIACTRQNCLMSGKYQSPSSCKHAIVLDPAVLPPDSPTAGFQLVDCS
ncbi:PiggyBac transposable element-derived protein 4 [Fusarium oxysporum f. sp. albedinis]|nr:PiggyBac transposable element-derived protein 4 [Fusarium oxysporum f. sp. albedinis]